MVRYGKECGRYPAVSITGGECQLQCEHCKGNLLKPMLKTQEPGELTDACHRFKKAGFLGALLSGGSDLTGRLPWQNFYGCIRKITSETGLFISTHTGFPDQETCFHLREAGVSQALIDVMGDGETATRVYHLDGLHQVISSLEAISGSGLQLVPHVVAGLFYGEIRAEYQALEMIHKYQPSAIVIVVLNPLKGTPMANVIPPSALEVGRLIATARLMMPKVPISLGCERPRNREGFLMERLAILGGANRMAIWSDEAVSEAVLQGLRPRFQPTCCSVEFMEEFRRVP